MRLDCHRTYEHSTDRCCLYYGLVGGLVAVVINTDPEETYLDNIGYFNHCITLTRAMDCDAAIIGT